MKEDLWVNSYYLEDEELKFSDNNIFCDKNDYTFKFYWQK